jgi:hypothetical protein
VDCLSILSTNKGGTVSGERSLRLEIAGSDVHLFIDDQEVASAGTTSDLLVSALTEENGPLRLHQGDSVQCLLVGDDRAAFLGALQPADDLLDFFEGAYEDNQSGDPRMLDGPYMDSANTVNDSAWAWIRGTDRWFLVPADPGQKLVRASAWMSESMTGAVIDSELRRSGPTGVAWQDNDAELEWVEVFYEVSDWDSLVLKTVGAIAADFFDPPCPACDTGWEMNLDVDASFRTELVGKALALLYRPCNDHCAQPNVVSDIARHDWEWHDDQWAAIR